MSLRFIRSFHSKRVPNYNGYWNLILEQPKKSLVIEQKPAITRTPVSIPFEPIVEEKPIITQVPHVKTIVYLNGEAIQLPEKPPPPENCCMSGCAHCVWDMYAEDMEDYAMKKSDIRNRFIAQGVPLPKELEKGNKDDAMAEMDPTMKAFLDMEKKLKNM